MSSRPILCAVDRTPQARRAARLAAALATHTGAPLLLVHAIPPAYLRDGWDPLPSLRGVDAHVRRAGAELLDAFARDLAPHVDTTPRLLVGDPAAAVLQAAAQERARLVVAGARGCGRLRRLVAGSVSERLTASARCPVLIAPPRWDAAPRLTGVRVHADAAPGRTGDAVAAAERERAALIQVTSSGRGPVASALLGAAESDLVRRAPCPVLVLPATARRARAGSRTA